MCHIHTYSLRTKYEYLQLYLKTFDPLILQNAQIFYTMTFSSSETMAPPLLILWRFIRAMAILAIYFIVQPVNYAVVEMVNLQTRALEVLFCEGATAVFAYLASILSSPHTRGSILV